MYDAIVVAAPMLPACGTSLYFVWPWQRSERCHHFYPGTTRGASEIRSRFEACKHVSALRTPLLPEGFLRKTGPPSSLYSRSASGRKCTEHIEETHDRIWSATARC